jgi:hypothetical protein
MFCATRWMVLIIMSHVAYFAECSQASGDAPPGETTNEEILRELNEPTKCEFIKTPLFRAAKFFANQHDISIHLDSGVKSELAIKFKVDGAKLGEALKSMLDPHGLEYTVVRGTILIRAKKR